MSNPALSMTAAPLLTVIVACSGGSSGTNDTQGPPPTMPQSATHGPFFPECGGVTDQTVAEVTRVFGLVTTARNSVGCQWLTGGGIVGPQFSFTWYRGSPIGRERKNVELTRTSVEDTNIDGHNGWVAVGTDPALGDYICEIAIEFSDDFVEWSVSYSEKPFPDPCDVATDLMRRSIAASK